MSRRRPASMRCPNPTKTPYGTEAIAVAALAQIVTRGAPRGKKPQRAYACECGKGHLTAQDAWKW